MQVELVTKTVGVGRYEGMSAGQIIEAVARHGKIKDYGKLIQYLVKHAHWSPLEHVHYGFKVETSRAISAQIFRHKSMHFQELSQRYDEITDLEGVELRKQGEKNRQSSEEIFDPFVTEHVDDNMRLKASELVEHVLSTSLTSYSKLLETGVSRETARMILPMTSRTIIHVTGNVRDLLAFLNVRCEKGTQKELRLIAIAIGEELENEMPEVMGKINWREGFFM